MKSVPELPVYERLGLEVVAGEGVRVRTADGRELLDLYGGHAAALLGYGHPALVEALERQARRLFFQTNLVELDVRREAVLALAGFAPPGLGHVFLVNSGAEANENALRLACRATGRGRVVALEGGFHGRTAAAAACSHGSDGWYGFPRRPFDVTFVPPDDEDALRQAVGPDTACVILEPVQGLAGARDLAPAFLRTARAVTAGAGAWLVADEVQCGMGRTGTPFAIQQAGVTPDAVTTAKGLGGGFPCGAVLVGKEASSRLGPGDLGTTFGGGPLACALISAVVGVLSAPGFLERVQQIGGLLRERAHVGPVTGVQGRGLLLGLRTRRPSREVRAELLERGVLAGGAKDPRVTRLMPPLTLEEDDVEELAGALAGIAP